MKKLAKTQNAKNKIMAFGPITSWQIDEKTIETVRDFIFGGSKITADGDCNHEIKRCLFLGRKAMTNLESLLKSRDITLLTKVYQQSYSFSSGHVWMWELDQKESWALKNWCFWTAVLEKTLEVQLVNLKELSPEYSLEGLMLKLKLQYFGYLTWRADSGKDPDAGKDWRQEKGVTEDETVGWHH